MSLKVNGATENGLNGAQEGTQKVFEELKTRIMALDSEVKVRATKYEVKFESNGVFCSVRINSKNLKVWVRLPEKFDDPLGKVKTMKWSPPTYLYVSVIEDVAYAVSLIRQGYEFVKHARHS